MNIGMETSGRVDPEPENATGLNALATMEIEDILSADCIVTSLEAGSKKHALQELAGKAAKQTGLEEHEIFDVLLERERLGTTGVGRIAIPHGKLVPLDELFGCFATLDNPVDFDAIDGEPVDLDIFASGTNGGCRSSEGSCTDLTLVE